MANRKPNTDTLVRTSILVREETDRELRRLAQKAHRPLSWEVRLALEAHVERLQAESAGAAA